VPGIADVAIAVDFARAHDLPLAVWTAQTL
jgi:hypothetical protein